MWQGPRGSRVKMPAGLIVCDVNASQCLTTRMEIPWVIVTSLLWAGEWAIWYLQERDTRSTWHFITDKRQWRIWQRSMVGGPGNFRNECIRLGSLGMLWMRSLVWREQAFTVTFYDVNPHVWLALFELSFALCNPHLTFLPGLRGEVSCSHWPSILALQTPGSSFILCAND